MRTFGAHLRMEFTFDPEKDELLIRSRGVSFLDVILAIEERGVLADFAHPNPRKYPRQRVFVVNIGGYAYCVPYEPRGDTLLLRTVYPNRRFKYLIEGETS